MEKKQYFSPVLKVIFVRPQNVLCQSGGINAMTLQGEQDGDEDYE